nr:MAG TPA: hypothetical protein [Caudoviricetes sp.]DAY73990.1 MAG TPA: hypothetical protein [Caudoviricetes sp.]
MLVSVVARIGFPGSELGKVSLPKPVRSHIAFTS